MICHFRDRIVIKRQFMRVYRTVVYLRVGFINCVSCAISDGYYLLQLSQTIINLQMIYARMIKKKTKDDNRDKEKKNLYKIKETIECKCCAVALLRHECNRNARLKCILWMPLRVMLWHMELTAITMSASVIGERKVTVYDADCFISCQ